MKIHFFRNPSGNFYPLSRWMSLSCVLVSVGTALAANDAEFYVSPTGNDSNSGTRGQPFATIGHARDAVHTSPLRGKEPVSVILRGGVYYLPQALVFTTTDSDTTYVAAPGETSVISGGMKLDLQWQPYKDGIWQAKVPAGLTFDQLFVNGKQQPLARYPNYDASISPYGGYAADAFSKQRAARWVDPAGGYIHAMHKALWGGYEFRITGKDAQGNVTYEGGWQNNRRGEMHKQFRFVDNIFEELDAPGEWFHNAKTGTLYYYPAAGVDLKSASVEVVRLKNLVEFNGAKNVVLRGFTFRHAARTFMETKEPLLRSDWTIYRGGAVMFKHSEDCTVADCELDQLGGNAIFVSGYNRRIHIVGCDIHDTGASAVAFVGEPKAVRNALFNYSQHNDYAALDRTPGPKTDDYPADCLVEDCLIRSVGMVEKQATGVEVAMSQGITIRHCSIYDTSRAGINFGDGCWGGNVIEFCDVFDTVKETSDHGSFNSWGRDRYWHLNNSPGSAELSKLALLDAVKPNIIRNSRWRCDHGWDVDLDDGSSNYEIYNNLFLNGGLKFREGFHRRAWNNIAVNSALRAHVWYEDSEDVVTNNIWGSAYQTTTPTFKRWGKEVDYNFFTTQQTDRLRGSDRGWDAHSLVGDPMYVNPVAGDFRVKDGSPALKLGFINFPMDQFGVQNPKLKDIARTPEIPAVGAKPEKKSNKHIQSDTTWQGAVVRNMEGEEFSVYGVPRESGGVVLKSVPAASPLAKAGLQNEDLIQSVNGKAVRSVRDLLRLAKTPPIKLGFVRGQETKEAMLADGKSK